MDDATMRGAIAGVVGGIVALILVIVLQAIGLLPAPGRSAAYEAADAARAAADATQSLERRLTAIEAMVAALPAMRTELSAITERMSGLETVSGGLARKSDVEAVAAALGTLREQVDATPPSATLADLDALIERVGRIEVSAATGGSASAGSEAAITSLSGQLTQTETALRTLTERLAAAEAKVAALGTADPMAGGEAAVRAIAITALRRASEGNAPFLTEVDMVASLGIAGDDVAKLRPIAAQGAPTVSQLVAEFPAVADAILSVSTTNDPNAGFLQRVVSGLGGLVSVRPAGPIPGDDPQAVVSRMVAAVNSGDLASALADRSALPESGKDASAEWAVGAAERVTLGQLVEAIAQSLAPKAG